MPEARLLVIDPSDKMRDLLRDHLAAKGYTVTGAPNGLAAARHMRQDVPDLVLLDQEVPMGGFKTARLLRMHPRYQQIPIVLLVDQEGAIPDLMKEGERINLKTFIAKPCSGATLEHKVAEGLKKQLPQLSLGDVREELAHLTQLPVLSPAHRKILTLLAREDSEVDVPEVTRTIESDQGLTMAVMRVCRSAFYGFRGNTIEGATTFLGIEKIRAVAQTMIVFDAFASEGDREDPDGFSLLELWRHALACGFIMEVGGHQVKGRDHFIAGILHDVGKVIMDLRFPDYFAELRRIVQEEEKSMYQAERELLGLTHADIGHELARKWGMPPTIATAIAFHHIPGAALQHRRLSALVHAANHLARTFDIGHGGDRRPVRLDESARPIARFVARAAADKKDEIVAQVESMIGG